MASVFVSYRRDDSADVSGRINDRLVEHFGESSIYKDVDNVPLGINFSEHIGEAVAKCDVLLAVIGPRWLTVSSEDGQRRLDNPQDYVRIEIEAALTRQIPVIPLLVRGATIPTKDNLPENLQELTLRNGISVRPDPDFHRDLDRLISSLEQHLDTSKPPADLLSPNTEESNRGDTNSQIDPRSRSTIFSRIKAKPVFVTTILVVSAFLIGVLATLFVTGNLLDSDGNPDSAASIKPVKTAREKVANVDLGSPRLRVDQQESSTDRDRPVWLTASWIGGTGLGELFSHYYAFYAGPGEVKVTLDERVQSGYVLPTCSVGVIVRFYNLEAEELFAIEGTKSVEGKRTVNSFELPSRMQLTMRIIVEYCEAEYMVKVEGAVEFVEKWSRCDVPWLMTEMLKKNRIFLASPGDVRDQRNLTREVIDQAGSDPNRNSSIARKPGPAGNGTVWLKE